MKLYIKSKLFGGLLSDGSFRFLTLPAHYSKHFVSSKNVDILNHPVWTGKRPKEQTEISSFIGRLHKGSEAK